MTPSTPEYEPPASSVIRARQNELDALRLLIAQRRLYNRAKRWLGLRWFGMVSIGIAAPVIAVLWPPLAVAASAVAGAWLFLARTFLLQRQTAITAQAAAVQEQFDALVFAMPDQAKRSILPSLEAIATIAGADDQLVTVAREENLIDWYPIDVHNDGTTTIAIAQRANASYSDSLIRTTAAVWSALVGVWIVALLVVSSMTGLSTAEFLLGVVFPVLPAFLDVVQYVTAVRRSATEKGDLAGLIEDHLTGRREPPKPEDVLVWQSRLFDLRRSAPEVPNFIYKLKRKKNERAMESAAKQLGQKANPTAASQLGPVTKVGKPPARRTQKAKRPKP